MHKLTQERLKEVLSYDPEAGGFKWLSRKGVPGHMSEPGTLRIRIDNVTYQAHRMAFLYMEGEWPEYRVEHIDGNRANNAWSNLRQTGLRINLPNRKHYRGVTWSKQAGKWIAFIKIQDEQYYLGLWEDEFEAALARLTAEDWCQEFKVDPGCPNRARIMEELGG